MKWLDDVNPDLGRELHKTDAPGKKNALRKYSLYGHKTDEGYRFHIYIFQKDLIDSIVEHLYKHCNETIRLGTNSYLVSMIFYDEKNLIDFYNQANSHNDFMLRFHRLTAFKKIGKNEYEHFPKPEKIISSLMKQWNDIFMDTKFECPKNLYEFVRDDVIITRTDLKWKKQNMGKASPFRGYFGTIKYHFKKIDEDYQKWCDILLRFGELSGVGTNRTAGYGRFKYHPKRNHIDRYNIAKKERIPAEN